MKRVVHLTSVHSPFDPRILTKECRTLAAAGYQVTLIVPHHSDEIQDGVHIRAVPPARGRFARATKTVWQIFRLAVQHDAELYHFHDPELIPAGLMLRFGGKPVVYDIHEDYRTSIAQKPYLPRWLRMILGTILGHLETWAGKAFQLVLAERYYSGRFPNGTPILNYPIEWKLRTPAATRNPPSGVARLLYTGGVSEDRGALVHAGLVHLRPEVEVHVIGRCSPELAARMRAVAGPHRDRLHIVGEGFHVPYQRILDAYEEGGWTAGLALFPATPHYRQKELTKFFEYMAAGIPVLCSDFGAWRTLIEGVGSGLCVDPADPAAIRRALDELISDREGSLEMARKGKEAVRGSYSWASQAEVLLGLYRSLIGPPVQESGSVAVKVSSMTSAGEDGTGRARA